MDFLAPLDDLAVLRISGEDAPGFLHAQLSNDINGLGADEARLAAYCNPKGRMLGSLLLWRETTQQDSPLLALVKADIVEPLLKRLRMFVLRAKVGFEPTTLNVQGVSRALLGGAPADGSGLALDAGTAWQLKREGPLTFIGAPAASDGLSRWWLLDADQAGAAALAERLGLAQGQPQAWHAQDIEAGLGWVEHDNLELFIPQSLNYDLSGGVSFTKGCYPGQEIVARAHFRGTVKRRGLAGQCRLPADAELHAGMDIFEAGRPGSPAGRIINAAGEHANGRQPRGWRVFMELSLADIEHGDFRAISPDGPAIRLLPLPYSLDAKPDQGHV